MANDHPLLEDLAQQAAEQYRSHRWEGSLETYLSEKVEKNPRKYTRTAFQILNDMLEYYGTEEVEDAGESFRRYKLWDDPFNAGQKAVYGLERTGARLGAFIRAAAHEEGKERIFVLVGPVGTAKTTMVDLISRGLEHYSATDEGEVFRITWRFARDLEGEGGSLGFVRTGPEDKPDVFAQVPCQLRDNPLLLIPRPERRRYLTALFEKHYPDPTTRPVLPRKILEGELCYNCTQIYSYLMRLYEGDWMRVVERVVVERFLYSEIKGSGIAKVLPEGNVESNAAFVAFDENYKALSMLLAEINLVKFNGKYVSANRGLMHYSDVFKRPVPYLQHLLSAVEEHRVDFGEVGADIDVIIVGTTNTPEYLVFRQDVLSRGIQSRMRRIDVPYLLNYREEEKIYRQGLREVQRTRHVAPHTASTAALWAVLTRLEKPTLHETDEIEPAQKELVKKLKPLEKALLFAGETPKSLSREARQTINRGFMRKLRNEFPSEGMVGVSPRIVQNLFADICETTDYECVTPFEFFRKMNVLVEEGGEIREHLSMESDGEYRDLEANLAAVVSRYDEIVTTEVKGALIDVDPEEIDRKIRTYLKQVTAYLKKEKVPGLADGKETEPQESLMHYVEDKVGVDDDERDDFRFKILARATDAAKENQPLDIPLTYKDLYDAVRGGLYEEKRQRLNLTSLKLALKKVGNEKEFAKVDAWTRQVAANLLTHLKEKYGYCLHCARHATFYAIDKKLIE